jgi:predicted RNA methylase
MSLPRVETVNVVTIQHGEDFAEGWLDGNTNEAFARAEIATWPEWNRDQQASYIDLEDDICQRVYDALKQQIAETFVRVANAAIDAERLRTDEALMPPRIETVGVVTAEHADTLIDVINQKLIDSGVFIEGFSEAAILTWPDDDEAAQEHYNRLADQIRDRLFADTRPFIAEAFVRIANAVIEEERTRPEEPLVPPRVETAAVVTREQGLVYAENVHQQTIGSEVFGEAFGKTRVMTFPDDDVDGEETAAQAHFHELTDEIRDRLHDETKELIADAFVRVANDVISRERSRR